MTGGQGFYVALFYSKALNEWFNMDKIYIKYIIKAEKQIFLGKIVEKMYSKLDISAVYFVSVR